MNTDWVDDKLMPVVTTDEWAWIRSLGTKMVVKIKPGAKKDMPIHTITPKDSPLFEVKP